MPVARYPKFMMAIHWLTAVLVVIVWFVSEGGRAVKESPPAWHFGLGLAVLLLALPRLGAKLFGLAPPLDPAIGPRMAAAAKLGHAALYALLIVLPLSGWYSASLIGAPIHILGVTLPPLVAPAPQGAGLIGFLHGKGGDVLLILAGLHGVIGLYHHFVLKDQTLRRMSPI